jgi:hypothetical protein
VIAALPFALALALAASPAGPPPAAPRATGPVAGFRADFPGANVIESKAGGRLVQASGFSAAGLGDTPEAAARAFLARYGGAFGITAKEELVTLRATDPGRPGAVAFQRRIAGLPVFDADVVVGVDGAGAVILVNAADVPTRIAGRASGARGAEGRAAKAGTAGLKGAGHPTVERGWRGAGDVIRPVWRVDFVASEPPGDWRSYVDAETGKVLFRFDRRSPLAAPPGPAAPRVRSLDAPPAPAVPGTP